MKKIFTIALAFSFAASALAQGPSDAILFSENSYVGTARTLAMGNAFVALGGELGAIPINPAATAIYRNSEVSVTPELIITAGSSTVDGATTRDNFTNFKFSNAAFLISFDTYKTSGLVNFSFSLSANRIADFNKLSSGSWRTSQSSYPSLIAASLEGVEVDRLITTETYNPYQSNIPWPSILAYDSYLVSPYPKGVTDSYIASTENDCGATYDIGGPLDQSYYSKSTGGILQYALNMGFNISDLFYFGFNIDLLSVDYTENTTYYEKAVNTSAFTDGFVSMSQDFYRRTFGTGFNAQFGAIITPVAGLRIGATFTTPTIYRLTDRWDYTMKSSFSYTTEDRKSTSYSVITPEGRSSYRVTSPLRWSVGVAYTFEEIALISVDVEGTNYSKIRMANYSGNRSDYEEDNDRISKGFQTAFTLRGGLEVRPAYGWFVRAGYNYVSTPGSLVDGTGVKYYSYPDKHYASCGFGYRFGETRASSLDLAYQRLLNYRDQYQVYYGAPTVSALNNFNRIVLTYIYRF